MSRKGAFGGIAEFACFTSQIKPVLLSLTQLKLLVLLSRIGRAFSSNLVKSNDFGLNYSFDDKKKLENIIKN